MGTKRVKGDKAPEKLPPGFYIDAGAQAPGDVPFKVGDVVQLKSGGFLMTVSCAPCGLVETVWASRLAERLEEGSFEPDMLRKVEPRYATEEVPF